MARTRTIAQLIAPAPAGGAETVVRSLMTEARGRSYPHHLVALLQTDAPSPLVEEIRAEGLPVTEIRCGRRRYRREAAEVAAALRSMNAGLIHSHVYHADLVGLWAAATTNLPIVATAHGLTGGDLKNRFYQWLDLRALRRFDAVIAVSRPLRQAIERAGVAPQKIHLIPNGFSPGRLRPRREARQALGLSPDAPVVGWIGRFTAEKDPIAFVDLVAHSTVAGTQAVMLGEGPLLGEVRDRAESLGLAPDRLITPGRVSGAASYLEALDALVLTSKTEGTPMVLLEAMAAGVPIAAYAVGGIPDFLNGDNSFITPAGDSASLAANVTLILSEPARAGERAARARETLERQFSPSAWLDSIETVYRGLLAG